MGPGEEEPKAAGSIFHFTAERQSIMKKNFKGEGNRKPFIDLEETSAVPEIHFMQNEPEVAQRDEEKEGSIRIIKEGVAVPEVMKEVS